MNPSERVQALVHDLGFGLVPNPSVSEADWSTWLEFFGEVPDPPMAPVAQECPECGGDLVERTGRYGKFVGCSGYPACKHSENR